MLRRRSIARCSGLDRVRVHRSTEGGPAPPWAPSGGPDRATDGPGRGRLRGRGLLGKHRHARAAARQGAASAGSTRRPGSAPSPVGTASSTGADWPEYDGNPARTGVAAGLPAAGPLTTAWNAHARRRRLRPAARRRRQGDRRDRERQRLRAQPHDGQDDLARARGRPGHRSRRLNGCGNIFPLGITGTPVYDPANGLVYAVAEVAGYHHHAGRARRGHRRAQAATAPSTSRRTRTSPPSTSSGPGWRSTTGGSTPPSAGCPETAAPTREASSARRSPATGR